MSCTTGELVYVPSDSLLVENLPSPLSFRRLEKPGVFLVVSDHGSCYRILHEGCTWLVKKRDTFKLQMEEESII
jgi:hypothetical protein